MSLQRNTASLSPEEKILSRLHVIGFSSSACIKNSNSKRKTLVLIFHSNDLIFKMATSSNSLGKPWQRERRNPAKQER